MKMGNRGFGEFAGAGIALCLLLGLAAGGCGSGGSTLPTQASTVVTRASEGNYSQDALILAARESTDVWISRDIAAARDADLATIRNQSPNLSAIHARPDSALHDVLVEISRDAPWRAAWEGGTLTTGDPAVDTLLATYKATGVAKVTEATDGVWFKVTFDQALNSGALAGKFKTTSTSVVNAEPNNLVGSGNNIVFSSGTDFRRYDFSLGWGDCQAGCTSRHHWIANMIVGGATTISESGTPLPPVLPQ